MGVDYFRGVGCRWRRTFPEKGCVKCSPVQVLQSANLQQHQIFKAKDYKSFAAGSTFVFCMSKFEKNLLKILSGTSDANVTFTELCNLLDQLGFKRRVKGSHHIFYKDGIEEIINLQPKGSK